MHFVYILFNSQDDRFYIGETADLKQRVEEHKNGKNKSTKQNHRFWNLVYVEIYSSKKDAVIREKKLKSHGSGLVEIKKRIKNSIKKAKLKTGEGER